MLEAGASLFDPLALALVAGGSLLAAGFSATRADVWRALGALAPLLRADPAREALLAKQAVQDIETIVELKGIGCADHVSTRSRFVRTAALNLVDAPSAGAFAAWADQNLDDRRARHEGAVRVWRLVADAAPAMGMIGTVIGLIGVLSRMQDPALMGSAMALAMLTTLYGLFVSAVIAGPIAARLERLDSAERDWQQSVVSRLVSLAVDGAPERREWLKLHLRGVE